MRLRNGLSTPGLPKSPRLTRICSGGLFVHIGVAGFDQVLGRAVHEVEVVAGLVGVGGAGLPFQSKPSHLHGVDDAVDVFGVFLLRVGVVKAQVAHAAVVARQAEVDADALGVADVQVAVGLGRKAGADLGGVWLARGVVRGVARACRPSGGWRRCRCPDRSR